MNYIELINNFWQKDIEYRFTEKEICLYFYLLSTCNSILWKNPFGLSNSMTMAKFGWGKTSFDTAKNKLKVANLIDFIPGNGRGNVYIYTIEGIEKELKKGKRKRTLSDSLSDSLSSAKAETSINVNVNSIPDSNESGPSVEKPAKEKSLYWKCLDRYEKFMQSRISGGAKIDGREGNAMKSIIAYLSKEVKKKDDSLADDAIPAKVLESWDSILSHWHYCTEWLQGRTRLVDINSEFVNILSQIKDGYSKDNTTPGAQPAGNTTGQASKVRNGGASFNDLENLKRNRGASNPERTEFTSAEVVK